MGIGVHLTSEDAQWDDVEYRVYANLGWCLDVKREKMCDPEEVAEFKDSSIDEDGFRYEFYSWTELDGFKDAELSEVLDLFEETEQL